MQLDLEAIARDMNGPSRARRKAEAMGFTFSPVELSWSGVADVLLCTLNFLCVCGTHEVFQKRIFTSPLESLRVTPLRFDDLVDDLWAAGAFSREHLVADGYSPEAIDAIIAKGERFDLEHT